MSTQPEVSKEKAVVAARSVALTAAEGARKGAGTLRDFHEEERLGRAYDRELLGRLWPFLRPHARYLWGSFAMILLADAGAANVLGNHRRGQVHRAVASAEEAGVTRGHAAAFSGGVE